MGHSVVEQLSDLFLEYKTNAQAKGGSLLKELDEFEHYYIYFLNLRLKLGSLSALEKAGVKSNLESIVKENKSLPLQFKSQKLLVELAHQNFAKSF